MRKITMFLSTFVLAAMLLAACGAEEPQTTVPNTEVPPLTEAPTDMADVTPEFTLETPTETLSPTLENTPGVPVTGQENPSRLSNLLEFNVYDQNNEQIGSVHDLVVDLPSTSVTYVIVEAGDKTVFVPWSSLQLHAGDGASREAKTFVFQGALEQFNNAPDTDVEATLPDLGQPAGDWDSQIRTYWEGGVIPGSPSPDGTPVPEMTATTENPASMDTGMNAMKGVILGSELIHSNVSIGVLDQLNGLLNPNATALPARTATPNAAPDNQGQQTMLEVAINDAILNTDSGAIEYVVIDANIGGVQRLIPVPLDILSWEANARTFVLNHDLTSLQNAPFFENSEYPDMLNDNWDSTFSDYWNNR